MLSFLIEKKEWKGCRLLLPHINTYMYMRRLWPCCAGCLLSFAHYETPFESYELDLFWPCYLQADSFNHIIWKTTHTHTQKGPSYVITQIKKDTRPKKDVKKCINCISTYWYNNRYLIIPFYLQHSVEFDLNFFLKNIY
jgi:hypothetical protein